MCLRDRGWNQGASVSSPTVGRDSSESIGGWWLSVKKVAKMIVITVLSALMMAITDQRQSVPPVYLA